MGMARVASCPTQVVAEQCAKACNVRNVSKASSLSFRAPHTHLSKALKAAGDREVTRPHLCLEQQQVAVCFECPVLGKAGVVWGGGAGSREVPGWTP